MPFMSRPKPFTPIAVLAIAIILEGCAGAARTARSSGYSAIFSNFTERGADWNPPAPAEIIMVSFSLPVDAYVCLIASGEVTFVLGERSCPGLAQFWIAMDEKGRRADWDTYKFHEGAFSLSSTYKLKKGAHLAYLMGHPDTGPYNFGYMSAHIVAIASQKGSLGNSSWFGPE